MPPALIALYSPAMGSGKGTVASILEKTYSFTRVKFAAPIKRMVEIMLTELGVPPQDLSSFIEGDRKETIIEGGFPITPRYMMQTLGNEWGREYLHPDIWVALAMRKVRKVLSGGGRVVVDDLRFPSEFDSLKAQGAMMVKVVRPGVMPTNNHLSEGRLDEHQFDLTIVNDGTVEALSEVVAKTIIQQAL